MRKKQSPQIKIEQRLLEAVKTRDFDTAESLLTDIDKVNVKSFAVKEAFVRVCSSDNTKLVKRLLDLGVDVNQRFRQNAPLAVAGKFGQRATFKLLYNNGSDPNLKGLDGDTPIVAACRGASWAADYDVELTEYEAIVRFLIKEGIDVNQMDGGGRTPISFAAEAGGVKLIRMLLRAGADVNHARNKTTANPLFYTVHSQNAATAISLLVKAGCKIDHLNHFGTTPLLYSVSLQNYDAAKALISYGADPHFKNGKGFTPLKSAHKTKNEKMISILEGKESAQ